MKLIQNLKKDDLLQKNNVSEEKGRLLRKKTIKELIAPSGIDARDIDRLEIISNATRYARSFFVSALPRMATFPELFRDMIVKKTGCVREKKIVCGGNTPICDLDGKCVEESPQPTCSINPATDCLSAALVDGECACASAENGTTCTSWTNNECGKGKY